MQEKILSSLIWIMAEIKLDSGPSAFQPPNIFYHELLWEIVMLCNLEINHTSVSEIACIPEVFPQDLLGLKLFQEQLIVKCFILRCGQTTEKNPAFLCHQQLSHQTSHLTGWTQTHVNPSPVFHHCFKLHACGNVSYRKITE